MKANKRSLAEKITSKNLTLKPQDNIRLAKLCGTLDENLRQIESYMQVEISNRGNNFIIKGTEESVPKTSELIERLYSMAEDEELTAKQLHLLMSDKSNNEKITDLDSDKLSIKCKKSTIKPSSKSQEKFIDAVLNNDLVFGVGAAGTGKTFLAVAMAAYYLEQGIIKKIFLARPAIEAGEKLGFLPGDLAEKVNPYLQPVYDALNELVGSQYVTKLVEKNIIEIVPLLTCVEGRSMTHL